MPITDAEGVNLVGVVIPVSDWNRVMDGENIVALTTSRSVESLYAVGYMISGMFQNISGSLHSVLAKISSDTAWSLSMVEESAGLAYLSKKDGMYMLIIGMRNDKCGVFVIRSGSETVLVEDSEVANDVVRYILDLRVYATA